MEVFQKKRKERAQLGNLHLQIQCSGDENELELWDKRVPVTGAELRRGVAVQAAECLHEVPSATAAGKMASERNQKFRSAV